MHIQYDDGMLLAAATDLAPVILFFHSLLRWGLLLAVSVAGTTAAIGWLRNGPVITWQRAVAIWAVALALVQLVVGFALYFMRLDGFNRMVKDQKVYWKFEHVGMMVVAIALVVIGRLASRKAKTERGKHIRVAIFYLLALVLMLWMIPWPFTTFGAGRMWL